ncbi:hypothetical protein [Cellulosilyticum sp. I15G10I2]|uniref:hypothetical protein n=1 Tax=Cellulosilyticum sp. I15G10I2 TaxID=1892843 RepID=UPI00085BF952|nr:hypothetical protein [Cellulosilyticum sp. I15G10I2]
MLQKPWVKFMIWFVSTSFFFMGAGIIISVLGPPPTEGQIMQYMSGMMDAMHSSLMGLSMSIEEDAQLKQLILNAASVTSPLILLSVVSGLYVRLTRRKKHE